MQPVTSLPEGVVDGTAGGEFCLCGVVFADVHQSEFVGRIGSEQVARAPVLGGPRRRKIVMGRRSWLLAVGAELLVERTPPAVFQTRLSTRFDSVIVSPALRASSVRS